MIQELKDWGLLQLCGAPKALAAAPLKAHGWPCPLPATPRRAAFAADNAALRLAPDRAWLLGDPAALASLEEGLSGKDGKGEGVWTARLEAGWRCLQLEGPDSAEALQHGFALDLSDRAFPPGSVAQALAWRCPCLLLRLEDTHAWALFAQTAYAEHVFMNLRRA